MSIQEHPELLAYVNAKLHPKAPQVGGFLEAFLHACSRADYQNFLILRPALLQIREKYPADQQRLQIELEELEVGEQEISHGK